MRDAICNCLFGIKVSCWFSDRGAELNEMHHGRLASFKLGSTAGLARRELECFAKAKT